MKKFTLNAIFFMAVLFIGFQGISWGQPLLVENFSYSAGSLVTANVWTAHNAPALKLDGVRVAKTWADIVGPSIPTWLGCINTDYHNAGNWVGGLAIPLSTDDVIIPSGCDRYPILDAGELLHCHNMEIGSDLKSSPLAPVMGISGEFIVDGNL